MFKQMFKTIDRLIGHLTAVQHYRRIAVVFLALLTVIGQIAGAGIVFAIVLATAGVFVVALASDWLTSQSTANGNIAQQSHRIRNKTQRQLLLSYQFIGVLAALAAWLIASTVGWVPMLGFLVGVGLAMLVGYFTVNLALQANTTILNAASRHPIQFSQLALGSGMISGLFIIIPAILGLSFYYTMLLARETDSVYQALIGLASGSSFVALLIVIFGTLFAKAPALLNLQQPETLGTDAWKSRRMAQWIGQQLADCAGVSMDLFATTISVVIASMLVGAQYGIADPALLSYPLVIMSVAVLSTTLVLIVLQKVHPRTDPLKLQNRLLVIAGLLNAILLFPISLALFDDSFLADDSILSTVNLYQSALLGLLMTAVIILIARLQISSAQNSSTSLLSGIVMCTYAPLLPLLILSAGSGLAYVLAGTIGAAIAVVAMLSMSAMLLAISSYQRMFTLGKDLLDSQSALPSDLSSSAAQATKQAYLIATSAMTTLVILGGFSILSNNQAIQGLLSLQSIIGFCVGILLLVCFTLLLIQATSYTAQCRNNHTTRDLLKAGTRLALIPAILPMLMAMVLIWLLGSAVLFGVVLGAMFGALILGSIAVQGGCTWNCVKAAMTLSFSLCKSPYGWQATTEHAAIDLLYRDSIVSGLSVFTRMLALLVLLSASVL